MGIEGNHSMMLLAFLNESSDGTEDRAIELVKRRNLNMIVLSSRSFRI